MNRYTKCLFALFGIVLLTYILTSMSCGGNGRSSLPLDATVAGTLAVVDGVEGVSPGSVVRVSADRGPLATQKINSDGSFSISVPSSIPVAIEFVTGTGNTATLVYPNPYLMQVKKRSEFLERVRIGQGVVLDLGRVSVAGDLAIGDRNPLDVLDFDKDGIVDGIDSKYDIVGLLTNSDVDGDGILNDKDNCPFAYNPGQEDSNKNGVGDVCEIGPLPLAGKVELMLYRNLSADELALANRYQAEITKSDARIKITDKGVAFGPLPMAGPWIVVGNEKFMADRTGSFRITKIPQGVSIARVYQHLSDETSVMDFPLYKLAPANNPPTAIQVGAPFPNSCSMDSQAPCSVDTAKAVSKGKPSRDEGGSGKNCLEVKNNEDCCLDYDGTILDSSGKYGANPLKFIAYIGSACQKFVSDGCCVNEGASVGLYLKVSANAILDIFGISNFDPGRLVKCILNHTGRNCQWMDRSPEGDGFYLSHNKPGTDTTNFSTFRTGDGVDHALPFFAVPRQQGETYTERKTISCGETLPLYLFNNICANDSNIRFEGRGTLTPTGVVNHYHREAPTAGRRQPFVHDYLKTLTYTAPNTPTVDYVTAQAGGFTRIEEISVVCQTTTPSTIYTSTTTSTTSSTTTTSSSTTTTVPPTTTTTAAATTSSTSSATTSVPPSQPPSLAINPGTFSITHVYGSSPCPTPIGTMSVAGGTNPGGNAINYSITNIPPWLSVSSAAGSVATGSPANVSLSFNCSGWSCGANSAAIAITGRDPASNLTTTLQAAVTVTVTGPPACP